MSKNYKPLEAVHLSLKILNHGNNTIENGKMKQKIYINLRITSLRIHYKMSKTRNLNLNFYYFHTMPSIGQ